MAKYSAQHQGIFKDQSMDDCHFRRSPVRLRDLYVGACQLSEPADEKPAGDEKKYPAPTYEQVSSDKTGYVETVEVIFNPGHTPGSVST